MTAKAFLAVLTVILVVSGQLTAPTVARQLASAEMAGSIEHAGDVSGEIQGKLVCVIIRGEPVCYPRSPPPPST